MIGGRRAHVKHGRSGQRVSTSAGLHPFQEWECPSHAPSFDRPGCLATRHEVIEADLRVANAQLPASLRRGMHLAARESHQWAAGLPGYQAAEAEVLRDPPRPPADRCAQLENGCEVREGPMGHAEAGTGGGGCLRQVEDSRGPGDAIRLDRARTESISRECIRKRWTELIPDIARRGAQASLSARLAWSGVEASDASSYPLGRAAAMPDTDVGVSPLHTRSRASAPTCVRARAAGPPPLTGCATNARMVETFSHPSYLGRSLMDACGLERLLA